MENYSDLIHQTFDFPNEDFDVKKQQLLFHGIPIMDLIAEYGTPLKFTFIPNVGEKIELANKLFKKAIAEHNYQGKHIYSYCTKSSHYRFILDEVLAHGSHIETSSAFDMAIVRNLFQEGKIDKDLYILCNGFKRPLYLEYIAEAINNGFRNCIPILDNMQEVDFYKKHVKEDFQVGIRVAAEEEPNFEFYTSRLGIRYNDIVSYYEKEIAPAKNIKLKMLHFFINTGIKDSAYYWNELNRFVYKYCELKKLCPELDSIDIGGGLPIKTSLGFEYDFEYMIGEIVRNIKEICEETGVEVPDIFTEFGSFTVAESGATIYSILDKKLQNDKELWYMIDGSFITHLPDTWGLNQRFILLPINQWDKPYHKVNLGGLTCDSQDYYNADTHSAKIFLPKIEKGEDLYIGFFNTGAYQDSLGGVGGIQHCLIPSPKHILVDQDENGKFSYSLFSEEQKEESMLSTLGYK